MARYLDNQKVCATCAFWSGSRETDANGNFVDTDVIYAKCGGGVFDGCTQFMNSKCICYKKWTQLKDD